ncbi:phage tail sheath family protein, partial [Paraburkholderia fungorum]|uniref:phage tail sheath family protein n=1 Tax=Paraburkholderia fungorum TaxID=134537 RepID=UPI00402BEBA4
VGLCYPHVKAYDTVQQTNVLRPLSIYACGAQARRGQENGYWWSASNTEILGITGMERSIDAMINDPNCEANLLNGAGIVTLFNSFGTGIRLWGNRSAAYPSSTSPKNFLCVRRVADVIAESLEYFSLQYQDWPMSNALIDAIIESGEGFLRKLKGDGAILDGRIWFDAKDNPATELAGGHLVLNYDFMPPAPLERLTYKAVININYLKQLGTQSA